MVGNKIYLENRCECEALNELYTQRKIVRWLEARCEVYQRRVEDGNLKLSDKMTSLDFESSKKQSLEAAQRYDAMIKEFGERGTLRFKRYTPDAPKAEEINYDQFVEIVAGKEKGAVVSVHCAKCDNLVDTVNAMSN